MESCQGRMTKAIESSLLKSIPMLQGIKFLCYRLVENCWLRLNTISLKHFVCTLRNATKTDCLSLLLLKIMEEFHDSTC